MGAIAKKIYMKENDLPEQKNIVPDKCGSRFYSSRSSSLEAGIRRVYTERLTIFCEDNDFLFFKPTSYIDAFKNVGTEIDKSITKFGRELTERSK